MILKKEKYSVQRKIIDTWLKTYPDRELLKEVSYIAISTGCPIIIVVEFIMEIKGRTEELLSLQKRLMKFYNIDYVV